MGREPALQLFSAHRAALVAYANGIVRDADQAEDLVQEAWLRFDEAGRGQNLTQPLGYLFRIVRNLALDGRRHMLRQRRILAEDGFDSLAEILPDQAPTPETSALYKAELERALQAIAELPERTRIALEMHRFGGCKLKEIAAFLGVSVPTAHLLVADGVQHCKERLGWK